MRQVIQAIETIDAIELVIKLRLAANRKTQEQWFFKCVTRPLNGLVSLNVYLQIDCKQRFGNTCLRALKASQVFKYTVNNTNIFFGQRYLR